MIGSLRYLCCTRPDLAYYGSLISRFMKKPNLSHLMIAKRILQYVKGTQRWISLYLDEKSGTCAKMYGYSNSDWCGDKYDRKNTAGYFFLLGTTPISWCSKKESVALYHLVRLSTLLLQWELVKLVGLIP